MDEMFKNALAKIEKQMSLVPLTLPEELRHMRGALGLIDMKCYNWRQRRYAKCILCGLR